MTEPLILDERAVSEVEAMFPNAEYQPTLSLDEVDPCEFCKGTIDDHKANCVVPHVRALCATVKHLRAQNEQLTKDRQAWLTWADGLTGNQHHLASKMRAELQSQLEQLRAENARLKRMIETPDRSDSMKIGIPQSPLCGDVNCPLHGDHPNTCVAQPVCSRGYVPPVNNTLII